MRIHCMQRMAQGWIMRKYPPTSSAFHLLASDSNPVSLLSGTGVLSHSIAKKRRSYLLDPQVAAERLDELALMLETVPVPLCLRPSSKLQHCKKKQRLPCRKRN